MPEFRTLYLGKPIYDIDIYIGGIYHKNTKSPCRIRWILDMRKNDFEIRYDKGKENVVGDQPKSKPTRKGRHLGHSKDDFIDSQRKHHIWCQLTEHLGRSPVKKLMFRNLLHNSQIEAGPLCYTVVRKDKGINLTLVVPDEFKALRFVDESVGHLEPSKTIRKMED